MQGCKINNFAIQQNLETVQRYFYSDISKYIITVF